MPPSSNALEARRRRAFQLGSTLGRMSDEALRALLSDMPEAGGWGASGLLTVGRSKTFVKRIPVTDRELRHAYSTKNRFRLPLFYNYGVGSAGFGAFRELSLHTKTTAWVLEGLAEGFPILFHHRIVRRTSKAPRRRSLEDYVRYWNGSKRVGEYMRLRHAASHELVLFVEHIPHTAARWLVGRTERYGWLVTEARATLRFLQRRGVVHFDAHNHNLLTDGRRVFITDFGLALDREHELSEREQRFLAGHRRYDEGELLCGLGAHLLERFKAASDEQKQRWAQSFDLDRSSHQHLLRSLVAQVERPELRSEFGLADSYVALTAHHRPSIELMSRFFGALTAGSDKRTAFDHEALVRALARGDRAQRWR